MGNASSQEIRELDRLLGRLRANDPTLTVVDLGGKGLGDAGAARIADALRGNTAVRKLLLHGNGIGADGARALASMLRSNSALTALNLRNNAVGEEGARALVEAVRHNGTLRRLWLDAANVRGGLGRDVASRVASTPCWRSAPRVKPDRPGPAAASRPAVDRSDHAQRRLAPAPVWTPDVKHETSARVVLRSDVEEPRVEVCLEDSSEGAVAIRVSNLRRSGETRGAAGCPPSPDDPPEGRDRPPPAIRPEPSLREPSEASARARMGMQLLFDVEELGVLLVNGEEREFNAKFDRCLRREYPSPNVFQCVPPKEIRALLRSHEQDFYSTALQNSRVLIDMVDQNVMKPDAVRIGEKWGRLGNVEPVVMDHTIREPATNTPYGHTAELKYLSWKMVRLLGARNIALSGLFYGDMYTVEEQFLHLLYGREGREGMQGGFVMCGPGEADRATAMRLIRECEVPNLFLDTTATPEFRRVSQAISQDLVAAVGQADHLFESIGYPKPDMLYEWEGQGQGAPVGHVYINLVDLMECVDLQPTDDWNQGDWQPERYMRKKENALELVKMFEKIKQMDHNHRVTGILFEESRGRACHTDYTCIAKWLRGHFPSPRYQILLHVHGGTGTEHAASLDAVSVGADGVWAAFIPQAARAGHNSYLLYLDNLMLNGNEKVWQQFDLHTGMEIAKALYSLNFNSVRYPDDCPVWGRNAQPRVHTAFDITTEGAWRSKSPELYHMWSAEEKVIFDTQRKKLADIELKIGQRRFENYHMYRVAPLVSDAGNIGDRMGELKLIKRRGRNAQRAKLLYGTEARKIMIATMNAGIRVNYDDPAMLKKVAEWVEMKQN